MKTVETERLVELEPGDAIIQRVPAHEARRALEVLERRGMRFSMEVQEREHPPIIITRLP